MRKSLVNSALGEQKEQSMKTKYILEITRDENGEVSIKGLNDGFSSAEIVGYLEFVKHGIINKNTAEQKLTVVA